MNELVRAVCRGNGMRVCLNLDPSRLLRWHMWTAKEIVETPGNEVFRTFSAGRRPLPSACRLLFEFERLLYRTSRNGAVDPMEEALLSLPPRPPGEIDVVVDFSGEDRHQTGCRVLTPFFNGTPGEVGIMAALVHDQELVVELHDSARPSHPWTVRPASTDRKVFSTSIDGVLSCAAALIAKAVRERSAVAALVPPLPDASAPSFVGLMALARAMGVVAPKAVRRLDALARGGRTWAIGWRLDESGGLLDMREGAFRVLTGGTHSYIADPFPFQHEGRNFIFFEQYPYATGRGCISVATVEPNGTVGAPRIILEEPHHLSYPFVFEHAGQIWMIPESGEARNVSLYRAVEFPYRWTREASLAEGIEIYDTTPLRCRDGFWFFGCLRSRESSSWDMLGLYRAEGLTKSWMPHADNPVVIDARLSRPAGAFIQQAGQTLRPVQDCARGYGGGVIFCRLDALDGSTFAQTPVGRIESGLLWCHTYNRQSGLEVVDLFGRIRDLREVTLTYGPASPDTRHPLPFAQDVVFVPGEGRKQIADDAA
jgi:hypothetical protein